MQAAPKVQLDFIDALRGVAIIGVLISHAQRNVEIYGAMGHPAMISPWLSRYAEQGARGVQLFFVISALTLFLSASKRAGEAEPWLNFYVRRIATVLLALAGTVLISSLTYRLVEVPGQALGKRLIQALASAPRTRMAAVAPERPVEG